MNKAYQLQVLQIHYLATVPIKVILLSSVKPTSSTLIITGSSVLLYVSLDLQRYCLLTFFEIVAGLSWSYCREYEKSLNDKILKRWAEKQSLWR